MDNSEKNEFYYYHETRGVRFCIGQCLSGCNALSREMRTEIALLIKDSYAAGVEREAATFVLHHAMKCVPDKLKSTVAFHLGQAYMLGRIHRNRIPKDVLVYGPKTKS